MRLSARTPVDNVSQSIIAGIALKLKHNAEVRVKYDLNDIYITQTRMFNRDSKYILHQKDLRDFMDQKLKGTYFGKDPVRDE